jgi:hypothetical protein
MFERLEFPWSLLAIGRLLPLSLFDFAQALVVEGDRLRLVLRRWSIFGIPLPSWLAPRSNSYETEQDGRFSFHVEISHPWTGLIVGYRGWLIVATRVVNLGRIAAGAG